MKKVISLLIISILVWLSNVSADSSSDSSTWTTDSTSTWTIVVVTSTWTIDSTNTWTTDTSTSTWITVSTSTSTWTTANSNDNSTSSGSTDDKREVRDVQKRFSSEFNTLKEQYKEGMNLKEKRDEYLKKKNELFDQYKTQLAETHSGAIEKREEIKINFKEQKEELKNKLQEKRQEIKKKYDNTYKMKYGTMISKLDEAKVNILIGKIDALIVKVNAWEYSDEAKAKLIAMLESLRELANKRLEMIKVESELNLDSLFQ